MTGGAADATEARLQRILTTEELLVVAAVRGIGADNLVTLGSFSSGITGRITDPVLCKSMASLTALR